MKLKILTIIIFLLLSLNFPALALKKRVWTSSSASSVGSSPYASIRLTNWKQNVAVTFSNVKLCQSITYELTYLSNNLEQGVFGSVKPTEGNVVSRSLFMGTCSRKVCVAHKNITNLRLEIVYKLTSGQSITKRYRINF
jgi:hypothetical protein